MQFVLIGHDKEGGLAIRKVTRAAHLEYWLGLGALFAGPMLGADGNPFGSILVIEAADEAAARETFEADPYVEAGLFEMISISAFRQFIDKGKLLS